MEKENNIFLSVDENQAKNERLDKFLAQKTDFSRAEIQRLIKNGYISQDGEEISDCAYKVKKGDEFEIEVPEPVQAEPEPQNIPLDVVYEDEDLLVINKPAGMVVHPGAGVYDGTLVNALLYHCGSSLSGIGGVKRPGIVHRIDKETSGLLVVAKNDMAHIGLSQQFEKHSIERTYFAFVYGIPSPLKGMIEGNIGRSRYDRKKMALLATGGKEAVTHYDVQEAFGTFAALVKCRLETGRTHQIRVHLSSKGHHLIGDKVYVAPSKTSLKMPAELKSYVNHFQRQALHAATLGFIHPKTKEKLFFESPFPQDLKDLYQKLHNSLY
ncbi:MAG: RluA family pseudouridine synthase [Alphaproteobacteria bacterium]|nr:RluA family pseudouridine synthase [Alphaproteobacteria bacterium]